ncbi:MAG: DUF3037 domain-containing protein [Terriglobales bacterium]
MPAPDLQACEFVLIRVAPDPIRNEAVNIGVALFQPQLGGFVGVRINPELHRVRQLSPWFEAGDLDGLEADLLAHLQTPSPAWNSREYLLQLSQEGFSHSLQFTPPAAVLTLDPAAELERLYREYAAPIAFPRSFEAGARRKILLHLERVFAQERILHRLARNVGAAQWLGGPDRFRFDFQYPDRAGHPCMIQALPADSDEGAVKELCFTVARLRTRVDALDVASFSEAEAALPASGGDPRAYHRELLAGAGVRVLALEQAAAEAARIRQRLDMV